MTRTFDRLSLQDVGNLRFESSCSPMNVGCATVVDAELEIEQLTETIRRRLPRMRRLRQAVVDHGRLAGHPLWVDDPAFEVGNHVLHLDLGGRAGQDEVAAAVERVMMRPLDLGRPLWEIWLLTGLAGGRSVVVQKFHHGMGDAATATRMYRALFLEGSDDALPELPYTPLPGPTRGAVVADAMRTRRRLAGRALRLPSQPRQLGAAITPWARLAVANARLNFSAERPWLNGSLSRARRLAFISGDLEGFRAEASAAGGSLNDNFMATVALAVAALARDRGRALEGASTRASVPVSLRGARADDQLGNQVGGLVVSLPLDSPDRRSAVAAARASALSARESQPMVESMLAMSWLAGTWAGRRVYRTQRVVNIAVTNVASPIKEDRVFGAAVVGIWPLLAIAGNVTLAVAMLTYNGQLTITAMGDAEALPDFEVFASGLRAAIPEARLVAAA